MSEEKIEVVEEKPAPPEPVKHYVMDAEPLRIAATPVSL